MEAAKSFNPEPTATVTDVVLAVAVGSGLNDPSIHD